jgi:Mrp family chromosome partitioning ATPase
MTLDRMYTWVDVQSAIAGAMADWPSTLFTARAYWDGLVLCHAQGASQEIENWMSQLLGPRWIPHEDGYAVRLESSAKQAPRVIPVFFEGADGDAPRGVQRRSFRQPDVEMRRRPPGREPEDLPVQVFAWHSFKGGVGRTTTAVQFARLIGKLPGATVMLVDMDFEAPGITWMTLESRLPSPPIAMSDVLALVHSSPPDQFDEVIDLIVERLRDSLVDQLLVLPALRSGQRGPEVRPEHLEVPGGKPLAEVLSQIATKLGVSHVIVDLRAGRSEHAASLLLDPRVSRVLVTTPAGQSVKGTCEMLTDLAGTFPCNASDASITILVSQLHHPAPSQFESVKQEIVAATEALLEHEVNEESPFPVRFTAVQHDDALLSLPLDWSDVVSRLDQATTFGVGHLGVDLSFSQWAEEVGPSTSPQAVGTSTDIDGDRAKLRDFATSLVTAEHAGAGSFLDAGFLRKLIQAHRSRLPVVIAEGSKGSGKTFTFLRLLQHKSWKAFAVAASGSVDVDGRVLPLTWSKTLADAAVKTLDSVLGTSGEAGKAQLKFSEQLDAANQAEMTVTDWRKWWLDRMAERAGLASGDDLLNCEQQLLFVIDGIEDLLPSIHSKQADQVCLRALLQEVPTWLRASTPHIGMIVFARSDYVRAAITQNTEQFRSLYRAFELRWDKQEALRLVRWTAEQAGVNGLGGDSTNDLRRIWGRKLGKDRSREGITEMWVMDALSTRKEEVQARDLVRLLAESARLSVSQGWEDRILAPQAIRNALQHVGTARIGEIIEEEPELGEALTHFKTIGAQVRVPFRITQLTTIGDLAALARLETAGIAWRDGEDYWLVSLYRRGLCIQLQPGRRERVLR